MLIVSCFNLALNLATADRLTEALAEAEAGLAAARRPGWSAGSGRTSRPSPATSCSGSRADQAADVLARASPRSAREERSTCRRSARDSP
jgi:hypothetical protein